MLSQFICKRLPRTFSEEGLGEPDCRESSSQRMLTGQVAVDRGGCSHGFGLCLIAAVLMVVLPLSSLAVTGDWLSIIRFNSYLILT